MNELFTLKASEDDPLRWVVFDAQTQTVVTFRDCAFNVTAKATPLTDSPLGLDPSALASAMRDVADWLSSEHSYTVIETPRTGIAQDIRVAMFDQDVSVYDLKELTGLSIGTINGIRFGWYNYKIDALLAVCRALSLDLSADEYEDE